MSNYKCVYCEYDLSAHKPGEKCPECGETILTTENSSVHRKLIRYEDKVISRRNSYVHNRPAALALAIFAMFGMFMFFWAPPGLTGEFLETEGGLATLCSLIFHIPFWLIVAFVMHTRLKHIESILHYRSLLQKQSAQHSESHV